jgi:ABC-type enterobactin transport system permease subunit
VAALLVWIMTKVCYHTDIWRALVACLVGGVLTAVVVYLAVTALGGKA